MVEDRAIWGAASAVLDRDSPRACSTGSRKPNPEENLDEIVPGFGRREFVVPDWTHRATGFDRGETALRTDQGVMPVGLDDEAPDQLQPWIDVQQLDSLEPHRLVRPISQDQWPHGHGLPNLDRHASGRSAAVGASERPACTAAKEVWFHVNERQGESE